MIKQIILATHNSDKQKELEIGFSDLGIEVLTLQNFPEIGEIIEDGNTLRDNALIKARTVFIKTKIPAIGDDTGLSVDSLNGEPGIYSARYSGDNATYSENVNKLLHNMQNVKEKERTAQFITCMAFTDGKMELVSEGLVKGIITKEIKGVGGFGYDPVFYVTEKNKTFAEMSIKEKNQISHRGRAIKKMCSLLKSNLPESFHSKEEVA